MCRHNHPMYITVLCPFGTHALVICTAVHVTAVHTCMSVPVWTLQYMLLFANMCILFTIYDALMPVKLP